MRPLTGRVQHYAWGSTDAIPQILGIPADGTPWAEYWLGAHASAPSILDAPSDLAGSGTVLDEYLAGHSQEIGEASCRTFGPRLPYLVKILSAGHSLSLQAHPSRAQAEAGFAAENAAGVPLDDAGRLFRDDWPKPEMIVALTDFDALAGFRDPAISLEMISAVGPMPTVEAVLEPLHDADPRIGLATVIRDCLTGSDRVRQALAELLDAARAVVARGGADRSDPAGEIARTAIELDADHPADPSILAALLMNRVLLHPGQQINQPAGTIHAYLRGTGIEIMANSDNVLRGGLTIKHIDIDQLLEIADLQPREIVPADPEPLGEGIAVYRTRYPEFRLWRVTPAGPSGERGTSPVELPATDLGRIILVTSGTLICRCDQRELEVAPGQAAWLAAGETVQVRATEPVLAFLAAPGV
ncbi:mannose-6-phosphate isomerase, class I [Acidipropionibacterium thoenii]|uniref:mannose-6-phosphate isomerase, class I n=1 Tax=Acidipropionibacterium thoenii TaxID=1751 RepID=UPI000410A815|nr:mannose-6-phosphate isomerase, class I [Acidipropionibacterium thoenii]